MMDHGRLLTLCELKDSLHDVQSWPDLTICFLLPGARALTHSHVMSCGMQLISFLVPHVDPQTAGRAACFQHKTAVDSPAPRLPHDVISVPA